MKCLKCEGMLVFNNLCLSADELGALRATAQSLLQAGLRTSTAKTYSSAQKKYLHFTEHFHLTAMPASEENLLAYIAYLHENGLCVGTIRVYLAAVRALHVDSGYGNPLEKALRVTKVLHALDINSPPPNQKLPITKDIMIGIYKRIPILHDYNAAVIWAAMTLAYFGCLRAGEMTIPQVHGFNPTIHLCLQDVWFETNTDGVCIAGVHVKRTKTDSTNKGFTLFISCSSSSLCFVCACRHMLARRQSVGLPFSGSSPLFLLCGGYPLTKSEFVKQTQFYLSLLGKDSRCYSGHSYRSGSATSAAEAGMPDWQIKLLGRWNSDAYQRYIRAPRSLLISFSHMLV